MAATVFRMPVSIFGRGASEGVGAELKAQGAKKVFLVTDEVLWKLGTLSKIVESLKAEQLEFELYDKLPTEPTVDFVVDGTAAFKKSGCNIILTVGGGTPIDTAKAISIMATNPGSIEDYMGASKGK